MRSSLVGWLRLHSFCFDVTVHEANVETLEELSHLLRYFVTDLYSILDYLIYTFACHYTNNGEELHKELHSLNFWVCPEKIFWKTNEAQERVRRKDKALAEWFNASVHLQKLSPYLKKRLGDFLLSFQRVREQKFNGDFNQYVSSQEIGMLFNCTRCVTKASTDFFNGLMLILAYIIASKGLMKFGRFAFLPPHASGWQPFPAPLRTVFFQVSGEPLPPLQTWWTSSTRKQLDFSSCSSQSSNQDSLPVRDVRNDLLHAAGQPFQQHDSQRQRRNSLQQGS